MSSGPARRGSGCCPPARSTTTSVPYFSLAMLPGTPRRRGDLGQRRGGRPRPRRHRLDDAAEPPRAGRRHRPHRLRPVSRPRRDARDGQRRHPSDNTDEPARARLACTLAEQGRAVAVVSSGDPGVFAMATAVLEEAKQWPGVQVRVIPAMTAAQAVASRVGAPLGPRLRGHLAVRPAQAVGGHRRAADRRRPGRPGAGDLQPRVEEPYLAGRRDAGSAVGAPRPRDAGGDRPRRVRARAKR